MDRFLLLPALLALAACGHTRPPPRTIDTRCGLDCEAQARYGLQVDRCFEYSDGTGAQSPPALGVQVLAVEALPEGGLALPVQYLEGGVLRMTDFFRFDDLDLLLARRALPPGRSLTYLGADGSTGGVVWVSGGAAPGHTLTTRTSAQVKDGTAVREAATVQVTVSTPEPARRTVPAGTYPDALQLAFSEEPPRGADVLRIFAPGVGFVRLDTRFDLDSQVQARTYLLQAVRDLRPGDPGCGEGAP